MIRKLRMDIETAIMEKITDIDNNVATIKQDIKDLQTKSMCVCG